MLTLQFEMLQVVLQLRNLCHILHILCACLLVFKCKTIFVHISSFHFLIQLHAYSAAEKLFLKSANDYNYLKQSNCLRIDGVNDSNKFTALVVMLLEISNMQPKFC